MERLFDQSNISHLWKWPRAGIWMCKAVPVTVVLKSKGGVLVLEHVCNLWSNQRLEEDKISRLRKQLIIGQVSFREYIVVTNMLSEGTWPSS